MVVFHILIIYICMISLYALKYYKVTIYFSFRFSLGRLDMITFDYYRIFYFVAKYKSFTKAAEVLQNSQPNISRCMGNLEQELECKLFMRSNRGIILTPEGKKLYKHVSIAYKHLTLGEEELHQDKTFEKGIITIGVSENALRLFLLDKLEIFHEQFPNIRIRIFNHSTPEAIRAMRANLIDLAVVTTPMSLKKPLEKIPLSKCKEILICGPKYSYLTDIAKSLKDLTEIPLISLSEGTGTYDLYNKFYIAHSVPFTPDMEVATTDQIIPMITHYLGIGFYPEDLATELIEDKKVFPINIEEKLPIREVCLVINKSSAMSTSVQKFYNFLRNSVS